MNTTTKKKGKKIKLTNNLNHKVFFGCVDNNNPKSLYINISSWATPTDENDTQYQRHLRELNKEIKQKIYNYLVYNKKNFFIKDRTIIDLDIRESGIKFGKKSFMSCEITLFSNIDLPINKESTIDELTMITNIIIGEVFNNNKHLLFSKTKK